MKLLAVLVMVLAAMWLLAWWLLALAIYMALLLVRWTLIAVVWFRAKREAERGNA